MNGLVQALAVGGLGLVGVVLLRQGMAVYTGYDGAGHDAFAAFIALIGLGTAGAAVAFSLGDGFGGRALYVVVQAPVTLAAVPWFAFAVRYVGRDAIATNRRIAVLAVPFLLYTLFQLGLIAAGSEPRVAEVFFLGWWVVIMYHLGLLFVGLAFLFSATLGTTRISTEQVAALAAPALVSPLTLMVGPTVGRALGTVAGIAAYAVGFLACAAAVGLSMHRYGSLESAAAAASTIGPEVLLRELDDAIVVVDDRARVVELNDAAEEFFDAKPDARGNTLESLLGATVTDLAVEGTVTLETTIGSRRFDAQTSELTDSNGRRYGIAVSLRDVTERDLREQRIRILNRVLRHNLRNKLTVVRGSAEVIPESVEATHLAQLIVEEADELLELGEQARTIETILRERDANTEPTAVDPVVEDVVTDARETFPRVRFETTVQPECRVRAEERALEYVLWELVENAAVHNDAAEPRIAVTVEACDQNGRVYLSVADNGPGIPEEELTVIRKGEESPLEHASGLDLWAIYWVVVLHGGDLSFEASEPRGVTVRVELPQSAPADGIGVPVAEAGDVTSD